MSRYSNEFKEQIVRKMMPPNSQRVAKISQDTGIAAPTLYSWRNQFRSQGYVVPAKPNDAEGWNWKSKAAAVLKTLAMNEAEKSEYCREQGIYPEQLEAWQDAFEIADTSRGAPSKADDQVAKKRIKQLEKELHRKEKALAEAAALLVLSKKAQAIWGTKEEE
jgi:transposase-like protein